MDCMGHCSRFWGKGEGCYGVVWSEINKGCWLKNSSTSTARLRPENGSHSALVKSGEMDGYDTACPHGDLSVNSLPGVEGIQYTTHCGKFIDGDDECFSGYPCLTGTFTGIFHAKSLQDCVRICTEQHPLCRAVSYNPGLEIGFANCRPRTALPRSLSKPRLNMGIMHAATISQIDPIERACPSKKTYTTSTNRTTFDIRCGQLSTGSNVTSVHSQNLTACMDACASSETKCVGALFDASLTGGYNNCYLQNTTNVVMDSPSATYAAVTDTQQVLPNSTWTDTPSASTTSASTNANSKSSSKAWIAGPVVGCVAAVAAIAFAIFWIRKRKRSRKPTIVESNGQSVGELDSAGAVGELGPGEQNKLTHAAPSELQTNRHFSELP